MFKKGMIKRHKLLARILLYSSPVLIAWGLWNVVSKSSYEVDLGFDEEWLTKDYEAIEEVRLFRDFLRIDTSYPDGNEIPAAEFLAERLEEVGIPTWIERLGDRNANMWGIIEGESPEALVLHNHLDVDPLTRRDEWQVDPFGGEINPPWIYGRGTFDMKSVTIAQLEAMLEIQRSGVKPKKSLIFLATGDEESGDSQLGAQWFIEQHPELVDRFWGLLTEGGAVESITFEDIRYWGTEFCQKRFIDVWICDASSDRLNDLRYDLETISEWQAKPQFPESMREFFQIYGLSRESPEVQQLLQDPDILLDSGFSALLPSRVKTSARNELAAFPVQELDGVPTVRLILHLMPGETLEGAWQDLLLDDLLAGFTYTVDESHPDGGCSDIHHPLFQGIQSFMEARYPDWPHGPIFVPFSATDARFFRVAGVPSYGYSPFVILSADSNRMTGPNERIALPPFIDGVRRYVDMVRTLVGP